jgi:hypothetical protein
MSRLVAGRDLWLLVKLGVIRTVGVGSVLKQAGCRQGSVATAKARGHTVCVGSVLKQAGCRQGSVATAKARGHTVRVGSVLKQAGCRQGSVAAGGGQCSSISSQPGSKS